MGCAWGWPSVTRDMGRTPPPPPAPPLPTRKGKPGGLFAEFDLIFVPINLCQVHWTLAVINVKEKRLEYYDSMGSQGQSVLTKSAPPQPSPTLSCHAHGTPTTPKPPRDPCIPSIPKCPASQYPKEPSYPQYP